MLFRRTTFALLFSVLIFLPQDCQSKPNEKITSGNAIKESSLAGSWYPAGKNGLSKLINDLFGETDLKGFAPEKILGIIVPHAGYAYSGKGAAYSFKLIRGKNFKRVVILAPSHYGNYRGFSTPPYTHYRTPLGLVAIDVDGVRALGKHKLHVDAPSIHEPEHSIEIELPFLQTALKDFKVLPVLIGELSLEDIDSISEKLRTYATEDTVFVISSDFTHYGDRFGYKPFDDKKLSGKELKKAVEDLDRKALEKIEKINCEAFRDYVSKTGATICGRNAIALFLKAVENTRGANAKLINYYSSADVTGEYDNTVSYASLVFYRDKESKNERSGETKMKKESSYQLLDREKDTLLKISRDTLELYLTKGKYPDKNKYQLSDNLKAKRGVFVTLHKKGALRGCIGYIEGILPVYQAVMENTVNAALEDPRFPNVTASETGDLDIEISVMTPLSIFKKPEEIEIGRDGLVISKGWQKGLLLPQVATEWKWDRTQFLEAVSNKAGLPRGAWKDADVKLEKFSAIVFGEKK